MPVQIRFRDSWPYIAEDKALGRPFRPDSYYTREQWDAVEPAKAGDIWRVHWHKEDAPNKQGPIAGYDILCIKCGHLHGWTTASNCGSRRPLTEEGTGKIIGYTCDHSGVGSCWTWTGSAEEGTLTAQPSLWSKPDLGGCGYHGFLTNGILSDG